MPRIAAASVREHRAQMQAKLIDAAERMLAAGQPLTAGSVAAAAGIARNSLYRYVDSVEDLRVLVANKHLPEWSCSVAEAMGSAATPQDKVVAYVESTLREAAPGGHAWVMRMAEVIARSARSELDETHTELADQMVEQVHAIGIEQPELVVRIVLGILQAGFERLEAGDEVEDVVSGCGRAAAAVLG